MRILSDYYSLNDIDFHIEIPKPFSYEELHWLATGWLSHTPGVSGVRF